MENPVAEIMTHPFFLFLASVAIFIFLVWVALPFAIYGLRRRIDQNGQRLERISETLSRSLEVLMIIQEQGEGRGAEPAGGENGVLQRGPSERLYLELRREMLQFAPVMKERVMDPENVIIYVRDSEGAELPGLILSLQEIGVQVSVPLLSLGRAFPDFSPEQFEQYASSFLPEGHGYSTSTSPDGSEFQVNIEPRDSNMLDLFTGIIREQLFEPIGGNSA